MQKSAAMQDCRPDRGTGGGIGLIHSCREPAFTLPDMTNKGNFSSTILNSFDTVGEVRPVGFIDVDKSFRDIELQIFRCALKSL